MMPPTSLFTKKCMQKEDNAFFHSTVFLYQLFQARNRSPFNFFSFKKWYLDIIGKVKLGQRLGRYHSTAAQRTYLPPWLHTSYVMLSFTCKFCVLYFTFCSQYSIFDEDLSYMNIFFSSLIVRKSKYLSPEKEKVDCWKE